MKLLIQKNDMNENNYADEKLYSDSLGPSEKSIIKAGTLIRKKTQRN